MTTPPRKRRTNGTPIHAAQRDDAWSIDPSRRHHTIGRLMSTEFNLIDALAIYGWRALQDQLQVSTGWTDASIPRAIYRGQKCGLVRRVEAPGLHAWWGPRLDIRSTTPSPTHKQRRHGTADRGVVEYNGKQPGHVVATDLGKQLFLEALEVLDARIEAVA